jgi:hypothetical protein
VKEEAWNGLTHQQFARYYLMKIGLGKELTRIALDPKHPYRLASEAEVLALCPELQHSNRLPVRPHQPHSERKGRGR